MVSVQPFISVNLLASTSFGQAANKPVLCGENITLSLWHDISLNCK